MDVGCPKCETEYELDDARVGEDGATVKCSLCAHVFRVRRTQAAITLPELPAQKPSEPEHFDLASAPGREWKLRQASGNVLSCRDLLALQKWIIEGKVKREDEVSLSGENWKRLGDIPELASFFQAVVEPSKAQPSKKVEPPSPAPAPRAPRPPPTRRPSRPLRTEPSDEELTRAVRGGGWGRWLLLLVLAMGLGGGAWYYVTHELVQPHQHQPEVLPAPASVPPPTAPLNQVPAPVDAGAEEDAGTPVDAGTVAEAVIPDAGLAPAPVDATPSEAVSEPKSYDWYLAQGDRLRERDKPKQALDFYAKAAELKPERVEPIAGRGLALIDLSKPSAAVATFEFALKLNSRYGPAIMGLAEAYRIQGKDDKAIEFYERYLEVLPNGTEASVARNTLERLKK